MDNVTFFNYKQTMPDVNTGFSSSDAASKVNEEPLVPFLAKFVRVIA